MEQEKTLSFYGDKFELKFWKELIGRRILKGKEIYRDVEFGLTLIGILNESHFKIPQSKQLFNILKEYYGKYHSIPFYDTIREIAVSKNIGKDIFFQFLEDIENVVIENPDHIKNNAKNFIQQQNFFSSVSNIEEQLKKGKITSFEQAVDKIRQAIDVNDISTKPIIVDEENFQAVDDENRIPISTGLGTSFDKIISGGPSRGDLCVVGASYGVGKTTFSAVVATAALLQGKKVVYIYFEGSQNQIISKFQANWSGLPINDTLKRRNKDFVQGECLKTLKKAKSLGGNLIIKKFDAINTKWADIEQALFYIEKVQGKKVDLLIIDYLECIKSDKDYGEKDYMAGPENLRKIEDAISENKFNCAAWVLIQGKKETYGVEDVLPTMLGGSADLLRIAHVLCTIGKSEEQSENELATINFYKNRLGEGRIKFKDCIFDNGKVKIKVEDFNIVSTLEKKEKEKKIR